MTGSGGWVGLKYWDAEILKGAPRQDWMTDEEWRLIEMRRSGMHKTEAIVQSGMTAYRFDTKASELCWRIQREHRIRCAMRADDV